MTEHRIRYEGALRALVIALFICVLAWLAGYRPFGLGKDFAQYLLFYSKIDQDSGLSSFRFEPAFVGISIFWKMNTGIDFFFLATIMSIFALLIKVLALQGLQYPFRAYIFYILTWFPLLENTQIRVAIAISFLFVASRCLLHNKIYTFIAVIAAACTFHMSAAFGAIVLIFAYYLSQYRVSVGVVVGVAAGILFFIFVPIALTIMNTLNPLVAPSIDASEAPNIISATNIVTLAFLALFLYSGGTKDRQARMYFLVLVAGFAVFFGFLSVPVAAHRLKEMLLVFMTFIAFEYRITWRTLPQTALAAILAIGSLYVFVSDGYF